MRSTNINRRFTITRYLYSLQTSRSDIQSQTGHFPAFQSRFCPGTFRSLLRDANRSQNVSANTLNIGRILQVDCELRSTTISPLLSLGQERHCMREWREWRGWIESKTTTRTLRRMDGPVQCAVCVLLGKSRSESGFRLLGVRHRHDLSANGNQDRRLGFPGRCRAFSGGCRRSRLMREARAAGRSEFAIPARNSTVRKHR